MSSGPTTIYLKKRERTQNWIPEEKIALLSLIKAHVNAIENKKIDAAASAAKSQAWQQIYSAFRGKFSTDRDIIRIREQWRRMKAQARMEMYTFAEKVRSLGLEEANKSCPTDLSIKVWRMMEGVRKSDRDGDRSEDSSQEDQERSIKSHIILDNLVLSTTSESLVRRREDKAEIDVYNSDDSSTSVDGSQELPQSDVKPGKRRRLLEMKAVESARAKVIRASSVTCVHDATERNDLRDESSYVAKGPCSPSYHVDESTQRAIWIFESVQREHEIKLQMLHIELERAEMQKQTAINELRTSEIKQKLIESQATEYYSQVKMAGERGSGSGKGGGGGGAIREAGGSFGKMEAAHEDQYFYNLQKQQLQKMRESLHDEISFHEEQIKRHQEAINRHKKKITDMEQKE